MIVEEVPAGAPEGSPTGAHLAVRRAAVPPDRAQRGRRAAIATEYGLEPNRFDEILPGCYDPKARVDDMDVDGVAAQLCFPSFPKFAGTVFLQAEDKELARHCVEAYNDFIIDEWCALRAGPADPARDPAAVGCRAGRRRDRALRGEGRACHLLPGEPVPARPARRSTPTGGTRCSARRRTPEMPLCLHFGSSGRPPTVAADAPFAVSIALYGCNSMYATADLLFSPVFHRFPRLKVALAEGGIGWVPYLLERIDYTWERHKYYTGVDLDTRPSDLFRRHIWGCFIDDEAGLKNRHDIGIDRITFESDYPHSDSNWPNSRARAAEVLADVPDHEVYRIVELNARELLGFSADIELAAVNA